MTPTRYRDQVALLAKTDPDKGIEIAHLAVSATPIGSRAESLFLLFQAGFRISIEDAAKVSEAFESSCNSTRWRVVRVRKEMVQMLNGEMPPRSFFW